MHQLSDIGTIKEILTRHGFHFSKAMGQNFLINPSVCPRMAESCGGDYACGVLEIGPGIGVLTVELAKRFQKVVSIELDHRLLPVLAETLEHYPNAKVIEGDVMEVDLARLIQEEFPDMRVYVCANLPYYITSPVIMRLLEQRLPVESVTVMVQKEAADRICALPGTRESGAVSVAVRYYADPELLFRVSRGSFLPAPKVDSAVIRLRIRKEPCVHVDDEPLFFSLVRASFGQRRKTLCNAAAAGLGVLKEQLIKWMKQSEIPTQIRAEAMTMEQFATLSNQIFAARKEDPNGQ